MQLTLEHQDRYSRVELLLRTFFGAIYILIPHAFVLLFVGFWNNILTIIKFWVVLFTGKIPAFVYKFQLGFFNWNLRLNASLLNLVDGYPRFGIAATSDKAKIEFENPERVNQFLVLVRLLFGPFYVLIPHGFVLFFRLIWAQILTFLAWWVVLFAGTYPAKWHAFHVSTIRWSTRVSLYMGYFTDKYPPFSGRPD